MGETGGTDPGGEDTGETPPAGSDADSANAEDAAGYGCRTTGSAPDGGTPGWLALAFLGLVIARRRLEAD